MKDTIGLTFEGCLSEIIQFPRCGPLAVFAHIFLPVELRGKGIGRRAHADRLQKAIEAGYKYAVCTVREDNLPERRILEHFKWQMLTTFENGDHNVMIFGKRLGFKRTYFPTDAENAAYERWEKSLERTS